MTARSDIDACVIALHSRDGEQDGNSWVHLLPSGTFSGRDGRGPYQATDAAGIMQASRQISGRSKMPIDYNHAIDLKASKGEPSPAAGWIVGLQSRRDGIWGKVEWTSQAKKQIADREYRYMSPVFAHTRDGQVTALLRAAMTNYPNLTQLVALASAEMTMAGQAPNTADMKAMLADMAAIRSLLGLPDDADITAVTGAIGQLKSEMTVAQQSVDLSQYVPIGDFMEVTKELRRVHQGVEAHAAKGHVEELIRKGQLLPFMKDWGISLCTVNKPALDAFIAKTTSGMQRLLDPSGTSAAPPPSRHQASDLTDTETHIASVLGHTPEQFNKMGRK